MNYEHVGIIASEGHSTRWLKQGTSAEESQEKSQRSEYMVWLLLSESHVKIWQCKSQRHFHWWTNNQRMQTFKTLKGREGGSVYCLMGEAKERLGSINRGEQTCSPFANDRQCAHSWLSKVSAEAKDCVFCKRKKFTWPLIKLLEHSPSQKVNAASSGIGWWLQFKRCKKSLKLHTRYQSGNGGNRNSSWGGLYVCSHDWLMRIQILRWSRNHSNEYRSLKHQAQCI